ncbi:MAG TPA: cytochrome C, partial [candidate division Zixibacteria bacterium]|nr:cytochrome C [candidate division Zixibacteria bacterium]
SHIYNSPDHVVDEEIFTNRIDATLPAIKRISVEAMAKKYETEEDAWHGIANTINDFYIEEYPEIYEERRDAINEAILVVQDKYQQNIFPEMKVNWEEYPNNIGHFSNPGCMRCHEGNLRSKDGTAITRECRSCHTILAQGSDDRQMMAESMAGLDFVHPEDIDEAWKEMGCYECHDGTQP